ncbi:hypothetical protein IGB42_00802 [Andreprevotia sp. IGB-42]|uniref:hypothetical protein n=1 Tax=Andreprevotia sp. IGB-42 TaxID=2497473 RepID=UPI00135A187C|nr:hypothetical protein [Andreprevotia sp. IGB-42]KAF0814747.1 hypothetical protein IGB42_00802 [Andreprevotia sp. IGB-42]
MWTKFTAGALLGFPLAVALTGLLIWLWPGVWISALIVGLLFFVPLWITAMTTSVLFPRRRDAWLTLAGLNLIAYALLFAAKQWAI